MRDLIPLHFLWCSSRPKLRKALGLGAPATADGSSGKADKTAKVASGHFDRLMKAAFGVEFLPSNPRERGYRTLDCSLYTRLVKYKAGFGAFAIVDDADPLDDPLEPHGGLQSP